MTCILSVSNLCKRYDKFSIEDMSFKLMEGTITGFIGENGAGKTTTLKMLAGLVKKESGQITYIDGIKPENIGFLNGSGDIYPDMKMSSLKKFVSRAYKNTWNEEKYKYYLSVLFGHAEDKKLKVLSTGMRMKFHLAVELAKQSKVILLDEPTTGLDPMVRDNVLDILRKIVDEEKRTVLFSSHITEDIEKIADNVLYIDNGRILLDETKEALHRDYKMVLKDDIDKLDASCKDMILKNGVPHFERMIFFSKDTEMSNDSRIHTASMDDIFVYMKAVKQ